MNPSCYDVLDVEPTASADEIRTAWRRAVAELDPTDRRFRAYNQAAEVLLDPDRRAAYDAEPAARTALPTDDDETLPRGAAEPVAVVEPDLGRVPPGGTSERRRGRLGHRVDRADGADRVAWAARPGARTLPLVPGWVLVVVAGLVAGALVMAGVLVSRPSDPAVEADTQSAQAAAERAIVPLLSYDAHHLDRSAAAAHASMTADEQRQYDRLFAVIRQNAPSTGTVVRAKYVASGIVRSGPDTVDVLVFVDQATRNKQHPRVPVVYRNQVTVTMAKVGDRWLVDGLKTNS